ncbi:hypothetical protein [uncultured Desulfuromonas sp.]|uniref:hypothetical protein n=1 Tax=uncultured Desulfuromonas sp. TaxID=181013 RepID=UPI002AAB6354|nr:hypothetical protein [uncultured Desulfuromonas sp.]
MGCELNNRLEELKALLQRERDCAIRLDMEELRQLLLEKMSLLTHINKLPVEDNPQRLKLLQQIAHENRRNARLFESAGTRVQRCLSFYFKPRYPQYGSDGHVSPKTGMRPLLSGRV